MNNWIEEAIEREAIPKPLREETTRDFCAKRGIPESTYYYEVNKKENLDRIEEICFRQAKKHTPEIVENLGDRAKTDNKAAELFLDYVLEKKKRFDLTSGDKPYPILGGNVLGNNSNEKDSSTQEAH